MQKVTRIREPEEPLGRLGDRSGAGGDLRSKREKMWLDGRRLTQGRLAVLLSVSPAFVSQVEAGTCILPDERLQGWLSAIVPADEAPAVALDLFRHYHPVFFRLAFGDGEPEAVAAAIDQVEASRQNSGSNVTDLPVYTVGGYLRPLRVAKGILQSQLAAVLGQKSPSAIWQFEQGYSQLRPENMATAAEMLGVEPREFAVNLLSFYHPSYYELFRKLGRRKAAPEPEVRLQNPIYRLLGARRWSNHCARVNNYMVSGWPRHLDAIARHRNAM